jgi:hypothetical protein
VARFAISLLLSALAACQPLALSLVGAGAGTAIRYGLDGVAYRTFTAPASQVMQASLAALERMGMTLAGTDRFEGGDIIYAQSDKRTISIEVEPISPRATRLRIAARNGGLFYDNATASELVFQTERLLGSAATGGSF